MRARELKTLALATLTSVVLGIPDALGAQTPGHEVPRSTLVEDDSDAPVRQNAAPAQEPEWRGEGRACEGCPPRSVGRALLQTTLVNVLYETVNLVRGQVTARITPRMCRCEPASKEEFL